MASTRVINYISYKKVAAASSLKHVCAFSNFYTRSDFRQSASYCTKKSITKANTAEYDNKMQIGFAEVGKFHIYSYMFLFFNNQSSTEYRSYFS